MIPYQSVWASTDMDYKIEEKGQRFVIGIEMRTSNDECQATIPAHWAKFYQNNLLEKIPNKLSNTIYVLYTEYESDYTKPYTYVLGCEVSSLDEIPEGMVGQVIPASTYAAFNIQGEFPQALGQTWGSIWASDLKRCYSTDMEVYPSDFNPQENPGLKLYIAIEKAVRVRSADKSEIEWINDRFDEVEFVHSNFDNEKIVIAEFGGERIGLGRLVTIDGNSVELGGIYVFEEFRNQGVAKRIVESLLQHAVSPRTIYCIPFEHLTSFYKQCGFIPCTDLEQVPREVIEKYQWCQEKYAIPTTLLKLEK